ncbi:hypothetical protein QCA50_014769 [Cerrena zonata]|uniref:Uncharacterized protein n=1 Tax=Cerrena zonata TaxID=2478898 RepID=A0AAW0FXZ8_9APHY
MLYSLAQYRIMMSHSSTIQHNLHMNKPCSIGIPGNDLRPESPVHRVLNIQEVLSLIFSFIHPQCMNPEFDDDERKKILRTLARAARTCKAFQLHASTLLWQEQHGLDAFSIMFERLNGEEGHLQHLLSLGERVKHLIYAGSNSKDDIRTIALMSKEIQGKSLFPNLQHIQLDSGGWPLTPTEASLLFSPGLLAVDLIGLSQGSDDRRKDQWGRLSGTQHQQICIHKLIKRSPRLQVFRNVTTHVMSLELRTARETRLGHYQPFKMTNSVTLRFNCPGGTVVSKQEKLTKASRFLSTLNLDQCRQLISTLSLIKNQDIERIAFSTTMHTTLSVSKILHLLCLFHHANSSANVDTQHAALPEMFSHYWKDTKKLATNIKSSMESFENVLISQVTNPVRPPFVPSQRGNTQSRCRIQTFVTSFHRLLRQTNLLYSILEKYIGTEMLIKPKYKRLNKV